jgi:hypothetical protein
MGVSNRYWGDRKRGATKTRGARVGQREGTHCRGDASTHLKELRSVGCRVSGKRGRTVDLAIHSCRKELVRITYRRQCAVRKVKSAPTLNVLRRHVAAPSRKVSDPRHEWWLDVGKLLARAKRTVTSGEQLKSRQTCSSTAPLFQST